MGWMTSRIYLEPNPGTKSLGGEIFALRGCLKSRSESPQPPLKGGVRVKVPLSKGD